MLPPLKKALEVLDLSDKQEAVLGVLLENGPLLVATIARGAKLNRTTAYDIVKELVDLGLVSHTKKDGATRYQALAPELLPSYIEHRRQVLEESKKQIEELVPQLKLLRAKGKSLPKVQFFEGLEGVKHAYEDVLESNKEKFLRGITDMGSVYKEFDATWLDYYLTKRTRLGIRCTDLVPEGEAGRRSKGDDEKYIRTTKFLPPDYDLGGDISIYDDRVAIFSYAHESPVAVIIEDQTISGMLKKLFDFMETHCK